MHIECGRGHPAGWGTWRPDGMKFADEHRKEQTTLATMSRNGSLVIAAESGHHVQIEQPQLVVDAIRQLIARPRP